MLTLFAISTKSGEVSPAAFRMSISAGLYPALPLSLFPLPDCLPGDGVDLVIGKDIHISVTD